MPNRTGKSYKRNPPKKVGDEFKCPKCERLFHSVFATWGHVGRAHPKVNPPYTHGTVAGYLTHRRRKEDACPGCKAAWRTYYRLKRQEKNA